MVKTFVVRPNWEAHLAYMLAGDLSRKTGLEVKYAETEMDLLPLPLSPIIAQCRKSERSLGDQDVEWIKKESPFKDINHANYYYLPDQKVVVIEFYVPAKELVGGQEVVNPFRHSMVQLFCMRLDQLHLERLNWWWWFVRSPELGKSANGFYKYMELWGYKGGFDQSMTEQALILSGYRRPMIWLGIGMLVVLTSIVGVAYYSFSLIGLEKKFYALLVDEFRSNASLCRYPFAVFLQNSLPSLYARFQADMRNSLRTKRIKPVMNASLQSFSSQSREVTPIERRVNKRREKWEQLMQESPAVSLESNSWLSRTESVESLEQTDYFLAEAISTQEAFLEEIAPDSSEQEQQPETAGNRGGYRNTSFREVVFGSLDIDAYVPTSQDPQMVRAILVTLFTIQISELGGRIASHHRRKTTLEQRVRSFYLKHLNARFEPDVYAQAFWWLLKQKAIVPYDPEERGGSYRLNVLFDPKPTDAGGAIVDRVLKLKGDIFSS